MIPPDATDAPTAHEAFFPPVLEALAQGVVVHRRDGTITDWNAAAERVLGMTGDQLRGRTPLDPTWHAVHPDGSPFPGEEHPASVTLRTGAVQRDVVMGINTPEGTIRWISVTTGLTPVPGEDELGVVATFVDITLAHRAEVANAEAARQLPELLTATDRVIVAMDAERRITMWNRAAAETYGFRAEEAAGREIDELLGTVYPVSREDVDAHLAKHGLWDGTLIRTPKEGRPMLAVSHQTLQRDHDGRPRSILEFTTIPTSATETLALVPSLEYAGDRGYVLAPVRDPTGKLVDARVLFVSAEVGLVHPIMARRPEATMAELYPEFARTRLFAVIERVLATGDPVDFHDIRMTPPWIDQEYILDGRAIPFGDGVAVRARDVTNERKALQALDDAQARVRLALDVAPAAVYQTDRDLVVEWAGGGIAMAGSLSDRIMGRRLPHGMAPESVPRFEAAAARTLATGSEERLDVKMTAPELPRYLTLILRPRRGADGAIDGLVLAALDISESVRLRAALEENERLVRTILDNTKDAVWLKDQDGRVLFANRSAVAHTNANRIEDLLGKTAFHVLPHSVAAEMRAHEQAVAATDAALTFELQFPHADGTRRLLMHYFPYRDRHGDLAGTGGIATDITERARLDAEVRTQAAAMREAADGIVVVRATDHVIVEANERFAELFGYEPADLEGRNIAIVNAPVGEDDGAAVAAEIIETLERDGRGTFRVHNRRRNGELFWTAATISPFDHPEHGPCWINVQRDITDQLALEEQMSDLAGRLADAESRLAEHDID